ncbi:hypothetical protein C1646_774066 [Rhizophagus diaphanus]|nr:hypothetical protein C1646_774066 [Rhizophagus diaphanus] [Rhizophagus sp. MUCL 43196]
MSGNYAKRGGGSFNPNSRKASYKERQNKTYSDNSNFNSESTAHNKQQRKFTPNVLSDMETNDAPAGDQSLDPTPTFTIKRQDFQAAAVPNAAPESLKKLSTNKELINAVNNHFLEIYESYTGKAHMTGSGDTKRLVIHFQIKQACDLCTGSHHSEFPDLVFHAHDLRQL